MSLNKPTPIQKKFPARQTTTAGSRKEVKLMQLMQAIVIVLALVPIVSCFLIWKDEREALAKQAEIEEAERLDDLFNIR